MLKTFLLIHRLENLYKVYIFIFLFKKIICNLYKLAKSSLEKSLLLSTRGALLILGCQMRITTKFVLLWVRLFHYMKVLSPFYGSLLTPPRWAYWTLMNHCDWPKLVLFFASFLHNNGRSGDNLYFILHVFDYFNNELLNGAMHSLVDNFKI